MPNASTYTDEYRLECADYVISTGKPAAQVAEGLGVHRKTLQHWVGPAATSSTGSPAGRSPPRSKLRRRVHGSSRRTSS